MESYVDEHIDRPGTNQVEELLGRFLREPDRQESHAARTPSDQHGLAGYPRCLRVTQSSATPGTNVKYANVVEDRLRNQVVAMTQLRVLFAAHDRRWLLARQFQQASHTLLEPRTTSYFVIIDEFQEVRVPIGQSAVLVARGVGRPSAEKIPSKSVGDAVLAQRAVQILAIELRTILTVGRAADIHQTADVVREQGADELVTSKIAVADCVEQRPHVFVQVIHDASPRSTEAKTPAN